MLRRSIAALNVASMAYYMLLQWGVTRMDFLSLHVLFISLEKTHQACLMKCRAFELGSCVVLCMTDKVLYSLNRVLISVVLKVCPPAFWLFSEAFSRLQRVGTKVTASRESSEARSFALHGDKCTEASLSS